MFFRARVSSLRVGVDFGKHVLCGILAADCFANYTSQIFCNLQNLNNQLMVGLHISLEMIDVHLLCCMHSLHCVCAFVVRVAYVA